ncbi:MAG TPA: FHA domain-containing protein [Anaerolineales bacterium]|nr:FHA domain-containing protein [Anaerolineales bacterium]
MDETKSPHLEQNVFLVFNRQIIPLEKNLTRLGRQLDNDIVFNEEFVSRFHAEIRLEEGKYVLYDNESTSGTFVNSKKIDRCVLNSGDVISLASIQIMFVNNNARLVDKARGTTQSLSKHEPKDK